MKVSERSIAAIQEIVTGDKRLSRYRTGPELVQLFNKHGASEVYGPGFPSRWSFAQDQLRRINGTQELALVLIQVLDPREFLETDFDPQGACDYLNARLSFDSFEVAVENDVARIRSLSGSQVEFNEPLPESPPESQGFIEEQVTKCDEKLRDGDFDGAVTNARSMLEAVLTAVERHLDSHPPKYDGDLPKLYKRVQKQLNLEPSRPDVDTSIKQVLTGLMSIVNGVAGMSNKMGDRHVRTYKPAERHAVLVVNSAKTLSHFVVGTYNKTRTH